MAEAGIAAAVWAVESDSARVAVAVSVAVASDLIRPPCFLLLE
jgi:hypothetical protein